MSYMSLNNQLSDLIEFSFIDVSIGHVFSSFHNIYTTILKRLIV